jgi:cytochrome P450
MAVMTMTGTVELTLCYLTLNRRFGAGKRVCLGMQFAMLEMKCFLSALLLRYKLEPVDGYEEVRPKKKLGVQSIESGYRVRVVPRK